MTRQPGDKFGRLEITTTPRQVYRKEKRDKSGWFRVVKYECKCECGTILWVHENCLRPGHTVSCGCWSKEVKATHTKTPTHGLSKHPLYRCWYAMKDRCNNPKHKFYDDYGGRGITVCPEWNSDDPRPFVQWGLTNGWQKGLSLDRKDNDGNYEPDNCWFVVQEIQNSNQRTNCKITAWGETKTLTQWTKDARCTVSRGVIQKRIARGMTPEAAIGTPASTSILAETDIPQIRQLLASGATLNIIAEKYHVSVGTISDIKRGKTWRQEIAEGRG